MGRREKLVVYFVLPIWSALILAGLLFYSSSSLKPFDPEGRLYSIANTSDFDLTFSAKISKALGTSTKNMVVHMYDDFTCICQLASSAHIAAVKSLVTDAGKSNVAVNMSDFPSLADIVPSVPSVAIFDGDGQLSYLGPYSTGIGCFTGNGTVEPYIDTTTTIGAVIPFDANGCYCNL